jgi:hypothetical protein
MLAHKGAQGALGVYVPGTGWTAAQMFFDVKVLLDV